MVLRDRTMSDARAEARIIRVFFGAYGQLTVRRNECQFPKRTFPKRTTHGDIALFFISWSPNLLRLA